MVKRYLVYFFRVGDTLALGQCKGKIYDRKQAYQTHSPYPVLCFGVIACETAEDMTNLEQTLIKRFSEHNLRGEWFSLATEILLYIQEHADYELGQQLLEDGKERKREYYRERRRERYKNDTEYRERQLEYRRKRRNDTEYKEYQREYQREYRARKKAERQATDRQQPEQLQLPINDNIKED